MPLNKFFISYSLLAFFIFGACQGSAQDVTYSEDAPKIFLRDRPKGGHYVFPQALFIGQLTIKNGCVQLIAKGQSDSITPTWPDYVKLMRDEAGYFIKVKNKTLKFGKTYHFGGGHYDVMPGEPIQKTCKATSQWLVGGVDE